MTEIQPAARELAALAAAMRGWDAEETLAAILAAKHAGWTFEQVYREVSRLLLLEDGTPASLRHAARAPAAVGPRPTTYSEGAAKVREALEHRGDGTAA